MYTPGYIFLAMCPAGSTRSVIAGKVTSGRLKGPMTTAETPRADVTVSEHILGLAPGRNGRPVLVDAASGVVISYSSFAATVRAAAAGLTRRGMRPGDVAGVYVSRPAQFALASHAIRTAGGVPAPIGPGPCGDGIAEWLADHDARILITDGALVSAARDLADRSRVRQLISFAHASGATRFDALLRTGTVRAVPRAGDDLALLAFAPGQEGKPRTLPVTHCELGRELRRLAGDAKLAAWDVIVAGPPCGDGRGYSTLLDFALTVGATVVAAPSADADAVLAVALSHRGTVAFVPPGSQLAGRRLRRITVWP